MTKIKKSIWSAVVGFVMCLTLVFGVVAGANTHRIAKADPEEAIDYSTEFVAIIQQYFPRKADINTGLITDETETSLIINEAEVEGYKYTKLSAYERANWLYSKLSEEQKEEVLVFAGKAQLDYIYTTVFAAPEAVIDLINNDIGVYIPDLDETELGLPEKFNEALPQNYDDTLTQYYDAKVSEVTGNAFAYVKYDAKGKANGYIEVESLKTAITYAQKDLVEQAETDYAALDDNQKIYVQWKTRDLYNKRAASASLETMQDCLTTVIDGSLELYSQVSTGVYYSYKGAYENIVSVYNKLDPYAQAGTEIAESLYPDVSHLGRVFTSIENAANAAKYSIAGLEYYSFDDKALAKVALDKVINYDAELIFNFTVGESSYRIVVDTLPSFNTATAALDAIYNGRKIVYAEATETEPERYFRVANCKVSNLSAEERAALETYLTELGRYNKVESVLSLYNQYAELVSQAIDELEVTGENHYKVPAVETAINTVYADYKALYDTDCLGVDEFANYSYNNVQKLISEENRAKLENYKTTLDTLNAWIKEVANLVKAHNAQETTLLTADQVIEWAWSKLQAEEDFGFSVNDKQAVETLLHGLEATEQQEAVDGYDQLVASEAEAEEQPKTNALQKAHDVLVYLEGKIDEALEEEEANYARLQELLEEMKEVLTDGVKYADRVLVDEFDELFEKITEEHQATLINSDNYKYYERLNTALNDILEKLIGTQNNPVATGVAAALNGIEYRFVVEEEYVFGTENEYGYVQFDNDGKVVNVVADSRPSIEAAQAAVAEVYNGRAVYANGEDSELLYRIATLTYAEWATEDVVAVGEENVNAFVYYFGQFVDVEKYYAKYEGSVAKLEELKALASELQKDIEEQFIDVLSEENHYRTLQTTIVTLYERYQALADYNGQVEVRGEFDNLQPWVTRVVLVENEEPYEVNGGEAIAEAYRVLEALNAWRDTVAEAIDAEAAEEEGTDYVIAEATEGNIEVTLSLDEIDALLEVYDEVTAEDAIKEAAVEDAYALLVARQNEINEAAEELNEELEGLAALLEEGVKYSDRKTYEELKERADELEELGAEINTENLETLKEALDDIESRVASEPTHASGLEYALTNIKYRHSTEQGYVMNNVAENGQIVAASRESIEAAQAAIEAVYNGREVYVEGEEGPVLLYRIANLTYAEWATEDVVDGENAFVKYEFLTATDYANYEAAVEALEELKALASELQKDIEEQFIDVLSEENHYRTLQTTIVTLYERYQALADYNGQVEVRGEFDNLQPWVTRVVLVENEEPYEVNGGEAIAEAYRVLEALNAWRDAVAEAIDAEAAEEEGADYVIAEATEGNIPVELTLTEVETLINGREATEELEAFVGYVQVVGQDPIKAAAVEDAYALLVARKDEINTDTNNLKQRIAELDVENITYKAKPIYDELYAELERLEALEVEFTPDDKANLDALGTALAVIERRAQAVAAAILEIEYYVDGEMEKDPTGEVVYDTKASLENATRLVSAIYPSTGDNAGVYGIAKLGDEWYLDAEEVEALAAYNARTGFTLTVYNEETEEVEELGNFDEYLNAYNTFNELLAIEQAIEKEVDDLKLDAEHSYKAQEAYITDLYARVIALTHEVNDETYNGHNNWIGAYNTETELWDEAEFSELQYRKIGLAYLEVLNINFFDMKVASLVDNSISVLTSTEEIDAFLAAIISEDVDLNDYTVFDIHAILDYYAEYEAGADKYDNDLPEEFANYKGAYTKSLEPAMTVLEMLYNRAKELNNELVGIIDDICHRADPENANPDDHLTEEDEYSINYVREVYEQFTWSQKSILENDNENYYEAIAFDGEGNVTEKYYFTNEDLAYFYNNGWEHIGYSMEEFFAIAERFDGANYYKQAVAELATQLGETYFTVEGYVLEKGLLAMYYTFDTEMKAMVESAYQKLLVIDEAYKEVNREDYTSYTSVTENLETQINDAKDELEAAQAALEADIIEALGVEGVETVKEALEAYKAAVAQAQDDLTAAQEALVNSITNSLDEEAESVEEAFATYKAAVAQAQDDLTAAQETLVNEIKTALGEEEAESVQAALENYKNAVEATQEEDKKAAAEDNKENDEKVEKLKKALIITAVVGGVVAITAAACIIALFVKMSAVGGAAGSSAAGSAAAKGGKEE